MYSMPVGIENFRELIQGGYGYVDKTYFIKELLDHKNKVTLITRPRRFGKTLTLSMLKEFFDINHVDDNIFDGLKISKFGEDYMQHRGGYPVVFISVKEINGSTYAEAEKTFCYKISELYAQYEFLRESPRLSQWDKAYFESIYQFPGYAEGDVDNAKWKSSIKALLGFLYKHYGKKPILLLDEYDAPIQMAWENGYYDKMIGFTRSVYSEAIKSNDALNFAVLTGVLRVAKESIFSGLNNLAVYSVLSEIYNDALGFTFDEVAGIAKEINCIDKLPELKEWYDGYNFGGAEIYNPWSVIQYFQNKCKPGPYWVNTSSNGIIRQMMQGMTKKTERELQRLMAGESLLININENIIYDDIGKNTDDLYSLLLTTGYLKANGQDDNSFGVEVMIPNKEIFSLFRMEIYRNMTGYHGISDVQNMLRAMLTGNIEDFDANLESILLNNVSCYDVANNESFYHGMMLGFCVLLKETHEVKSNRESGYGRFDIALIPRASNSQGVVLEFKRAASETELRTKAQEALHQIDSKAYVAELQERHIHKIWKYGIAFCGKKVAMEYEVD